MAGFQKIGELQQFLKVLALRIGNKLDYTKLSQLVGISRPTLSEYLEFLEKTYVIYRLPAYAGPDKAAVLGGQFDQMIHGMIVGGNGLTSKVVFVRHNKLTIAGGPLPR